MNYRKYVNTENLRRERYSKKISSAKMAEVIGKKSKCSYMNIENGVVEPKITDMIKISEFLGEPIEYFFNLKVHSSCTNNESA